MQCNHITRALILAVLANLFLSACSIKRLAVNVVGDALSHGGGVYTSDDDPELVREALPFGLKTYESLLSVSPEHQGLLLSAARGFTAYAYLLQNGADKVDATDVTHARQLRERAKKLYLRGRGYALRGLDVEHGGFASMVRENSAGAVAMTGKEDVPFLYWAGVSWAAALAVAKDDVRLIAELPTPAALVERVLQLDETYKLGAAHEFFVSYEGSRPGGSGAAAREHYRRAVEISRNQRASVHLALAEAVSIKEQNLPEFRALIAASLAVDPDKLPELRLENTIARGRAVWLESRIPDLFLETDEGEKGR